MATTIELGIPGTQLTPGDHICAFYRGADERDGLLLPALGAGLDAGDKCLCIVDSTEHAKMVDSLDRHTHRDVTACLEQGQLELKTSKDVYLKSGRFSSEQMFELLDDVFLTALNADGYPMVRSTGEMIWAAPGVRGGPEVEAPPGVEELIYYEAMLNLVFPHYGGVGICFYDLDHFWGDIVLEVLETHSKVMIGGMLLENPYYVPPQAEAFRQKWKLSQSMYDRYWPAAAS